MINEIILFILQDYVSNFQGAIAQIDLSDTPEEWAVIPVKQIFLK